MCVYVCVCVWLVAYCFHDKAFEDFENAFI